MVLLPLELFSQVLLNTSSKNPLKPSPVVTSHQKSSNPKDPEFLKIKPRRFSAF